MRDYITFGDLDYHHEIGNKECHEGWCGENTGYPHICDCGGLVHANFGDDADDGYWLYTKCDKCGENESHV